MIEREARRGGVVKGGTEAVVTRRRHRERRQRDQKERPGGEGIKREARRGGQKGKPCQEVRRRSGGGQEGKLTGLAILQCHLTSVSN